MYIWTNIISNDYITFKENLRTLNKVHIEIKKFKKLILSKKFVIFKQKNCLQIKNKDDYDLNNYCYKLILFMVLMVFLAKRIFKCQ